MFELFLIDPYELWMSTDGGNTFNKMNGFVPSVSYWNIRVSVSMASPTAIYAFYGDTGTSVGQDLMVCSPVGPNCNFRLLTTAGRYSLCNQYTENIVLLADPNLATRAYIGGYSDYVRVENVNFATGSATYINLNTNDGSYQHSDGRIMVKDANGDLLEGIICTAVSSD